MVFRRSDRTLMRDSSSICSLDLEKRDVVVVVVGGEDGGRWTMLFGANECTRHDCVIDRRR